MPRDDFSPQRIADLALSIRRRLGDSIGAIEDVNGDIHVLSINAKIQAARAGSAGAGFAVVADEVRGLVHRTRGITAGLQTEVERTLAELMDLNRVLSHRVRGQRLAQVAATALDIVDRNLYERSCDVRWWATEEALVQALTHRTPQNFRKAGRRLGVILDSYTVYHDLVLCSLDGEVLANGRPGLWPSAGTDQSGARWFQEALKTASGAEYGFEGVHRSALAGGRQVLVYSCLVRREGEADGAPLGVLGIVFNWEGLGQVVAGRAAEVLGAETDRRVAVGLFHPDGTLLAASGTGPAGDRWVPAAPSDPREGASGFQDGPGPGGVPGLAAFAVSAGFETYRTGWHAAAWEDRS